MPNQFCHYLSNQVRIEYGFMKPCCWWKDQNKVPIDDEQKVLAFRQQLSEITSWEDARGNCDECRIREQNGQFSPRLHSLNDPEFAGGISDDAIIKLEIQIDRDCNGACLVCGPWNSNTWEKYNSKVAIKLEQQLPQIQDSDQQTLQQIHKLKKIFSLDQSKSVRFLGGEPLRNNHHVDLLRDVRHPETMTLNYTTNGSYRPTPALLEFWSRFYQVNLLFSIDGIGEHFNYLRWPLQWHQVESNIEFILDKAPPNIRIAGGSYTTTPLSLWYHDRYVEAFEDFERRVGKKLIPWFDRPWQPRGITPMELTAVPPALAQAIQQKYGDDHAITKLLVPYSAYKNAEFKHYINLHDRQRNTNWRQVFPEMQQYFD